MLRVILIMRNNNNNHLERISRHLLQPMTAQITPGCETTGFTPCKRRMSLV